MSPPSPGAKSAPPGNLHVDWPWGQSGTSKLGKPRMGNEQSRS